MLADEARALAQVEGYGSAQTDYQAPGVPPQWPRTDMRRSDYGSMVITDHGALGDQYPTTQALAGSATQQLPSSAAGAHSRGCPDRCGRRGSRRRYGRQSPGRSCGCSCCGSLMPGARQTPKRVVVGGQRGGIAGQELTAECGAPVTLAAGESRRLELTATVLEPARIRHARAGWDSFWLLLGSMRQRRAELLPVPHVARRRVYKVHSRLSSVDGC